MLLIKKFKKLVVFYRVINPKFTLSFILIYINAAKAPAFIALLLYIEVYT